MKIKNIGKLAVAAMAGVALVATLINDKKNQNKSKECNEEIKVNENN
ncbi:MAG: hypothetical protein IJO26_00445 [Clostridium sp.]|nr:hypothetical protein [Clostridium sp.]